MRRNGTCDNESTGLAQGEGCEATHKALLTISLMASPEVTPSDLGEGVPSLAFASILHWAVAAALDQKPEQVNVSGARLIPQFGSTGNESGPRGIKGFDVVLVFCALGGLHPTVEPNAFERAFVLEAQNYAAMALASTAVLSLERLGDNASELVLMNATEARAAAERWRPPGSEAPAPASAPSAELLGLGKTLAISLLASAAVVLLCLSSLALGCYRRRRRLKVHSSAEEELLAAAALEAALGAREAEAEVVLAHVAYPFAPSDVQDDKAAYASFREHCLELSEGDVVEVVAGGSGWFYGRVVGSDPERAGYLPESCVSWIGQVPAATISADEDKHQLVSVEHAFCPADVDEGEPLRERCLKLEAGEMVRVVAGGAGWLYGYVVGAPEREGYFPENRATWYAPCDGPDDAASTEQGHLVQVSQAFSPGTPGDKDEEAAAFCESCIAVAEGDVVEVVAAGGGWLYGRVVGAPERMGYLPETRVSWMGNPVDSGVAMSAASAVGPHVATGTEGEEAGALRGLAAAWAAPDDAVARGRLDVSTSIPAKPGDVPPVSAMPADGVGGAGPEVVAATARNASLFVQDA